MPDWRPIHENHAIDVMATAIALAQPVPSLVLRRMLRAAEEASFGVGLKSRHSTRALQIAIAPQGVQAALPQPDNLQSVEGMLFNALFEDADGLPIPGRVAEQLQVTANAVVYRTWRYVSWSWQIDRIRPLFDPVLSIARDIVPISTVRLEYLDRFWFDGDVRQADTARLLRTDCPQLAPHIFGERELWHVHTGAFLTSGPPRRLQLVQVDAFDAPAPDEASPLRRWIHIMTALEDRFPTEPLDESHQNADFPMNLLNGMHSELKVLLGSIITEASASRIYLNAQSQQT